MSDDAIDALPKILTIGIIGAFIVAVALWHAFIKNYVYTILQQDVAVLRVFGLLSALVIVGIGMAAVLFPLILTHKRRMHESFDGYEVSYSLRSFLPKKLIGTATVERIRHDDGHMFGLNASPQINARRERLSNQRDTIECEHCHKSLYDIYEPGRVQEDPVFTYIERYTQYYIFLPIYASHIETLGYCPNHRPDRLNPT